MKRFVKRVFLGFLPALLAATALVVPNASPELGLQNVQLSCSDGTDLALALDGVAVTRLADAVASINLYPAGEPALGCSLGQSDPVVSAATSPSSSASSNPQQDYAVGGGRIPRNDCGLGERESFSLDAHVNNNTLTEGVGGHFNLTIPGSFASPASFCQPGHLVARVDCLSVSGNTALFTALVTKATGSEQLSRPVGTELAVSVVDGVLDAFGAPNTTGPCQFIFLPGNPVVQGNISVHDAP